MIKVIFFDFFGVVHGGRSDSQVHLLARVLAEDFKLGLISNASQDYLKSQLSEIGIDDLFEFVIASAEAGVAKPSKEIFTLACKTAGVEPAEALFIDDQTTNVDGAKKTGMKVMHYENFDDLKKDIAHMLRENK